jgi:phenylpyruvate tautomerase PptA (4-oxalocrotonate tautomerase family)
MPLISVDIVGPAPDAAAALLADRLGELLVTGPGRTWVRVRRLDCADYAEQQISPADIAAAGWPVFVEVLLAELPDASTLDAWMQAMTLQVSKLLERPADRVHVVFAPAGAGRVAFGGQWVRGSNAKQESP